VHEGFTKQLFADFDDTDLHTRSNNMTAGRITGLYYITHINNISSILSKGILSHERVESDRVKHTPIYNPEIVKNRQTKPLSGKSLWSFANLYFQPRNPMLYQVICEKSPNEIAILSVKPDILNRSDIFISIGNAASLLSEILPASEGRKSISMIRNDLSKEWWSEEDGSKRKIMAECLVPDVVPPEFIREIYVANLEISEKIKATLKDFSIQVIPEPKMFFQPSQAIKLTHTLSILEGDMFFSRMQTLTVSVNCVGVMGKGLASRAKYQFPDVYVFYQDLCRRGTLNTGKPYIYKREGSFDYELADAPLTLTNANLETWFLLFPTKHDWRKPADIAGIEEGLKWLQRNYKREGIKSLAVPALGCGLGKLDWHDVGPLICRYLATFDIPIRVYLPTEKKVPLELLTKDFLLAQT
jgi:O-acetyl-ADP-ribose deacetylase (regulator of RNase III)